MKLLILLFFTICVISFKLKGTPKKSPSNNIYDAKLDISNNKTYKGRIFNGHLITQDYHNYSNIFPKPKYNFPIDYSHLNSLKKTVYDDEIDQSQLEKVELSKMFQYSGENCLINKNVLLDRINFLRSKHGEQELKWDRHLESKSLSMTNEFKTLQCRPDPLEKIRGQLVLNGFGKIYSEEEVVDHFYEGAYKFPFSNVNSYDFRVNFYDFAQIIWNATQYIGCAKACCVDNQIWVCNMSPAAEAYNVTLLKKNVLPPIESYKMNFN